jgi:ArsR family transcriptional regulator
VLFIICLNSYLGTQTGMKIHKKEEFGKKRQHLAMLAKAISHPARISILKILARKENCNCNDLVEQLPLSQSTVSQHLKELKNCGLINGTVRGTSNIYSVNRVMLKEFQSEFKKMIKSVVSKR